MHRLFLRISFSLLLIGSIGYAQGTRDASAPTATILNSFESAYHQATDIHWHIRPGGGFIARFLWRDTPMEAHYDGKGDWLFTNSILTRQQLPEPTQVHLRARLGRMPLEEVGYHNSFEGDYYYVRYRVSGQIKEILYNQDGQYLRG